MKLIINIYFAMFLFMVCNWVIGVLLKKFWDFLDTSDAQQIFGYCLVCLLIIVVWFGLLAKGVSVGIIVLTGLPV